MAQLRPQLPYMNFYRFCQLLEKNHPKAPIIGSGWLVGDEPIRFRPHPGMGFPAGEIRGMDDPEPPRSPAVRVTFMGLYGVESPLPTHYSDDIAQRREGVEATEDFLDIFNHRLIAQYYRIWRKYSYPATFRAGGTDNISQYLLGLAGLWALSYLCIRRYGRGPLGSLARTARRVYRPLLAAALLPGLDARACRRVGWRDRHAHESPNSAWSEAPFAGALGLRLGGPAWYGPLYRDHPWLGDGSPLATARHILQSVRLMWASVLVFAALASLLSALMACI